MADLRDIKNKIARIKKSMQGSRFTAAKRVIESAVQEVKKDNFDDALKQLKEAEELIGREKEVGNKVDRLRSKIKVNGYSDNITRKIWDNLRNGELEEAEKLISDLEDSIEKENKVLSIIGEAEELASKKLAGANIEEAERLRKDAENKLREGEFGKAEELAESARLSAKPTTEYLLGRGRELAENAENSFEEGSYEQAIDLWRKSLDEYYRAKEVAEERNEQDILERLEEVESVIRDNIEKAETAIDNREMVSLISEGNNRIKRADNLYKEKQYDEAKEEYERARRDFEKALEYAQKRSFSELNEISEALNSIDASVEACLLSKGEQLISLAEEVLESGKPAEAETKFSNTLEYLDSINVDEEALNRLKQRCGEKLIESKVKKLEAKMKEAEDLFNAGKYYDAKEVYRETRNTLEDVVEEATSLKATSKLEHINSLIQACTSNMNSAVAMLTGVKRVDVELITADAVARGGARYVDEVAEEGEVWRGHPIEKLKDEYSSIEYIGGGGFADVFRAVDRDGNVVALKVPRELTREGEKIFVNEFMKWVKLDHRNIVKLIEPRIGPIPHLVMEYVDGKPLSEVLRERLDVEEACKIAYDVAKALEYAHSQLIDHTDIKPQNILLKRMGKFWEVKLTDFGLAVVATKTESIKGLTEEYSAPEQIDGKVFPEKTDVFQLSLVLYEMLTGFNPFESNSGEVRKKIRELSPEPPSKYNKLAEGLDDIIRRGLAKNPEERPAIREIREVIYEYMKRRYGISLHLTKDYETMVRKYIRMAYYCAKEGDLASCLSELRDAESKIRDSKIRKACRNLAEQVEYMSKEGLKGDSLLKAFEDLLKLL